ncbi:MAG: HEAT repeat domain-containing protein [Bradymonadales bacterium]|nr:HEAT repeat domain-containing protein [Bradymonadales bacterium]
MPLTPEEAIGVLESFLKDQRNQEYVEDAIEVVIAARDREGLALVTEAIYLESNRSFLGPLFKLALNPTVGLRTRIEAMRAISATLVVADTALGEVEKGQNPRNPPLLAREEIDREVVRLMALYRQEDQRAELRQLALEIAACVANTNEIRQAGRQALASGDPDWIATGAFVVRCVEKEAAREVLKGLVDHPDRGVRFEVIQALVEVGTDKELELIEDLVLEGSGEPQITAMWALSKVDSDNAGEILAEAARWMDGEIGIQARAAYTHWCENWPAKGPEREEKAGRKVQLPERLRVDGVYYRRESFSERIICD